MPQPPIHPKSPPTKRGRRSTRSNKHLEEPTPQIANGRRPTVETSMDRFQDNDYNYNKASSSSSPPLAPNIHQDDDDEQQQLVEREENQHENEDDENHSITVAKKKSNTVDNSNNNNNNNTIPKHRLEHDADVDLGADFSLLGDNESLLMDSVLDHQQQQRQHHASRYPEQYDNNFQDYPNQNHAHTDHPPRQHRSMDPNIQEIYLVLPQPRSAPTMVPPPPPTTITASPRISAHPHSPANPWNTSHEPQITTQRHRGIDNNDDYYPDEPQPVDYEAPYVVKGPYSRSYPYHHHHHRHYSSSDYHGRTGVKYDDSHHYGSSMPPPPPPTLVQPRRRDVFYDDRHYDVDNHQNQYRRSRKLTAPPRRRIVREIIYEEIDDDEEDEVGDVVDENIRERGRTYDPLPPSARTTEYLPPRSHAAREIAGRGKNALHASAAATYNRDNSRRSDEDMDYRRVYQRYEHERPSWRQQQYHDDYDSHRFSSLPSERQPAGTGRSGSDEYEDTIAGFADDNQDELIHKKSPSSSAARKSDKGSRL